MYYLVMPSVDMRQALMRHLKSRNIDAVFHYTPLHLSKMGRSFGGDARCPQTERVSDRLVRLPFHTSLSREDQDRVVEETRRFFENP